MLGDNSGEGVWASAQIQVVQGSLDRTAAQLRSALTVVEEVTGRHDLLAASARAAGDPSVVEAIESFLAAWASGLRRLTSDGETLATVLVGAAGRYRQLEDTLAGPIGGR